MMRATVILGIVLAACSLRADEEKRDSAKSPGDKDIAAIEKLVESYVAAFNQGDAKAIADHWSEAGEWVSPAGDRIKGRQAIQEEMAAYFAETGGRQHIEVTPTSIRIVAPTVAIEEGHARVTRAGEAPSETSYIAVHIKEKNKWKLESVRETLIATAPSNYEFLHELEWMVGTWVDGDENSVIETSCDWTKNKNFLTRSFSVHIDGRLDMQGTQVVGWDASRQQIRSWLFDSNGGFGEGVWTRDGNKWIVKSSQVLQGGARASSINIITRIDNNSFTWQSTGREIDGELQPSIGPVTVVRK